MAHEIFKGRDKGTARLKRGKLATEEVDMGGGLREALGWEKHKGKKRMLAEMKEPLHFTFLQPWEFNKIIT